MGVWKDNFKLSSVLPRHDNPLIFTASQWQSGKDTPSIIYLLIRLAIFITFLVIWTLTITMETPERRLRWPVYLTNWGLSLCLIQSFLSCLMLICSLVRKNVLDHDNWADSVSKIYSTYWVFNVMATSVAFTITFVYWTLVFKATGSYWSTMNFMVHGFNSILMFVDFWIVAQPVRILHFVYPVVITLAYVAMTAIFYVAGGTMSDGSRYIYPMLKWDEPGKTIAYCIAIAAFMVLVHILTFFMYLLRTKIYEACVGEEEKVDMSSDPSAMAML